VIQNRYDYYFGESGGCECQPPERPARVVIGGWPARGVVYERGGVAIGYTRCRPTHDGMGQDIHSGLNTLAFPTRGVFRMHTRAGEAPVCDPNTVILQNAAEVFRTSHPEAVGDDTVWVTYEPGMVLGAVRPFDADVDEHPETPFPCLQALSEPQTFLLMRSMFNEACRGPDADEELIEHAAASLLEQCVRSAFAQRSVRQVSPRRATAKAHADMAEASKAYMAAHMQERITIEQLARHVHSSPFHLCRLFRRHTGMPIHRYLNRLRLRASVERLHEHRSDLATLAAELGFASHSHFCDAFRREFGQPPSAMRQQLLSLRSIVELVRHAA
jgi:AraC-like DNA-binding protein